MKDYLIRAETKAAWDAYAEAQGWIDNDNVHIDELGPVVITPGDPPVMDMWHHVNLRILEESNENQSIVFIQFFDIGRQIRTPKNIRAIEDITPLGAIQILYPEDILTQIRIWANGMQYAALADMTPVGI